MADAEKMAEWVRMGEADARWSALEIRWHAAESARLDHDLDDCPFDDDHDEARRLWRTTFAICRESKAERQSRTLGARPAPPIPEDEDKRPYWQRGNLA